MLVWLKMFVVKMCKVLKIFLVFLLFLAARQPTQMLLLVVF